MKYILMTIVLFTIGAIIRFLYCNAWLCNAKIIYDINPIDLINLVLTPLIAIYLGHYIVKKLSEQRFNKEFIIRDLRNIEENIDSFKSYFRNNDLIDISTASDKLECIRLSIDRFHKTSEIMAFNIKGPKELRKIFKLIYKQSTNFDENPVNITRVNTSLINKHCESLISETRKLVHAINNL